jgi:hypothetical protein
MLERAVDRVPLRRAQLVEIAGDALAGLELRLAVRAPEVLGDVFPREHRLGDVVGQHD